MIIIVALDECEGDDDIRLILRLLPRLHKSTDKTVRLWDTATGTLQQTLTGHSSLGQPAVLSPNGRLLAPSSYKRIWLWDTAIGALQRILGGHSRSVYSVAFSPDDQLLTSGSSDKTVRLWNTATGSLQ